LVRAANAQAVFFAVDAEIGVADADSVSRAVLEATRSADNLEALIESPDRPDFASEAMIVDGLTALLASAREVEQQIVSGDVVSALDENRGTLEQSFAIVSIAIDDYRETVRAEIAATENARAARQRDPDRGHPAHPPGRLVALSQSDRSPDEATPDRDGRQTGGRAGAQSG
jgi:hypothetical protein